MRLTASQTDRFLEIEEGIQERKPVLLTGRSNGKTQLMHQALAVLGQRDEKTGGYTSTPRHTENRTVEYFPRIAWPRSDKLTMASLMRQIIGFCGERVRQSPHEVVIQFDALMRAVADDHRIITLAVDNAELLPTKAFTIMKALNEYFDPRKKKNIGVGLLIAGEMRAMKRMPQSFLLRCTEVLIGKITNDEIEQLIQDLYPSQRQYFTAAALKTLTKCGTTLEVKATAERCILELKQYKLKTIDHDLVEERLAA